MQIFFILHIVISIFLIILIVLQPPQEDGMIAGGSSSSNNSIFSSGNSDNFLNKLTKIFAGLFLSSCLFIAYLSSSSGDESLLNKIDDANMPKNMQQINIEEGQSSKILNEQLNELGVKEKQGGDGKEEESENGTEIKEEIFDIRNLQVPKAD